MLIILNFLKNTKKLIKKSTKIIFNSTLLINDELILIAHDSPDLSKYYPIVLLIIISTILSAIIFLLSYFLAVQNPDKEKISPYECGFDPFDDARDKFDVKFYLVAILFIIFDLEISFLIPWSISLGKSGIFGFWSVTLFVFILIIGFIYEWKKGALEWE